MAQSLGFPVLPLYGGRLHFMHFTSIPLKCDHSRPMASTAQGIPSSPFNAAAYESRILRRHGDQFPQWQPPATFAEVRNTSRARSVDWLTSFRPEQLSATLSLGSMIIKPASIIGEDLFLVWRSVGMVVRGITWMRKLLSRESTATPWSRLTRTGKPDFES